MTEKTKKEHKESEQEDFQRKFVEYNIYKSQVEGIVKELALLNSTANNLQMAKQTLENINELKEKPEVMLPIGGNAFLKADVKDTEHVLVGIGSDVIVKKGIPDAVSTIEKQLDDINKARNKMEEQVKDIDKKMSDLEPAIQEMAAHLREKRIEKEK